MKLKTILDVIKHGREVCESTYETAKGKFAYSGLLVFADSHRVSVYKNAQLIWSTTDEFEVRRIRRAQFERHNEGERVPPSLWSFDIR